MTEYLSLAAFNVMFPFARACRRIGIDPDIARVSISRVRPRPDFIADGKRPPDYDVRRVRHFVEAGIPDAVRVKWADGLLLHDGFHRYVAAHLRGDESIPVRIVGHFPAIALSLLKAR